MTLNICEQISSVELIKLKENIASLQLCLPGIIIYNLKLHKKKTNIENCLIIMKQSISVLSICTLFCICHVVEMFVHCGYCFVFHPI